MALVNAVNVPPTETCHEPAHSEGVRQFMASLDRHPCSYKHYAITIGPLTTVQQLLDGVETQDDKVRSFVSHIGGHVTWINEVSEKGKNHIHGVLSTRKAIDFKKYCNVIKGYQIYFERVKLSPKKTKVVPLENWNELPDDVKMMRTLNSPIRPVTSWIYYVCKEFKFQNKSVKYFKK